MELGAFSVSLAVRDLEASIDFYERLGFEPVGGDRDQGWVILRNGEHVLGLFRGMFEKNVLTFNPGWNQRSELLAEFTDVRDLRDELERRGINVKGDHAPGDAGTGSIMLEDPDGNPVLIDQHR